MAKRNVAYIKPEEPAFLKRIKDQIGYQEPSDRLEAKRGPISNLSDEDDDDYDEKEDEKPQVVQLKKGDLTAEEAAKFAKEEAEKPADLSERVIFKAKKKKDDQQKDPEEKEKPEPKKAERKSRKSQPTKSLLSFNDDEEDGD